MTDETEPSATPPAMEASAPPETDRVESVFSQIVAEVSREDVQEVMDSFEDKLKRIRKRPEVTRIEQGLRKSRLFYTMLRAWWNEQFTLPWRTIAAVTAALLYFINPMDVIPDFLFMGGLLDDATVLYLCYRWVESDLWTFVDAYDLDPARYGMDEDVSPPDREPT